MLNLAAHLISRFDGVCPAWRGPTWRSCRKRKGWALPRRATSRPRCELGRRLAAEHPEDRPIVASPQDVMNLLGTEMSLLDQEQLRVILLDTRNRVLGDVDGVLGQRQHVGRACGRAFSRRHST